MEYRSRQTLLTVGLLALILILGGILTYVVYLSPTGMKARENADLTRVTSEETASYAALDGTEVDLDSYRGSVMVVNVWASWSPYTQADHEALSRIKSQFNNDISVIAINRKEAPDTAIAYLETIGKKPGIEYIIDSNDNFFSSLGGYAMPETIVFDAVGNVQFHKRGTIQEGELVRVLEALLANSQ